MKLSVKSMEVRSLLWPSPIAAIALNAKVELYDSIYVY